MNNNRFVSNIFIFFFYKNFWIQFIQFIRTSYNNLFRWNYDYNFTDHSISSLHINCSSKNFFKIWGTPSKIYLIMLNLRKSHPLIRIANNALVDLPAPVNISAWWNFGSLLGICLVTQILTGLFLAIHYTGHVRLAFDRVAHISRDVNYGWLLRAIHANGASFFFYLSLSSCGTRYILFFLFLHPHLVSRGNHLISSNSNCLYRIRANLRTNIFLSCHSNYKPTLRYPLFRTNFSTMNLRGVCGR